MIAVRAALATDKTLANESDASGNTPLMHAAYAGTYKAMEALLEAGATVNAANLRKATALHWAVHDADKVKLMRVLCKLTLTHSLALKLGDDLEEACKILEQKGGLHESERKRVHTGTGY